ncbi:MAG: Sec7 domain-containing protein [Candidatus Rickettsia vulgarisii]
MPVKFNPDVEVKEYIPEDPTININKNIKLHQAIDEKRIDIVRAFNQKPKNGVEMLRNICTQKGLDDQQASEQLATLFIKEKSQLNLDYVGDYLSGPNEDNKETLKSFIMQQDFKDKSFVQAMRDYLQSFKLPGEGQKIDRLVEVFGAKYCADNSKEFTGIEDKDAAYILAYQTIMLNSDLHKDGVQNKMTLEQLKNNVRGCNAKGNFPDQLLEGIYKEIKKKPFELNFVETPSGYNLTDKALNNDPAYKEIKDIFKDSKVRGNIIKDSMKVTINQSKSWLTKFTGYEGTMTVKDKDGASATIQLYQPNIFSRWFLGEKSKVIIQPGHDSKDQLDKKNIDLAAKVTAGFKTIEVKEQDIKAGYHYAKEDLQKAYTVVKGKEEEKFVSIVADVAKDKLLKIGESLAVPNKNNENLSQVSELKRRNAFYDKSGQTKPRSI